MWLVFQVFVQFTIWTVFEDHVDLVVVIEEAIQLHYVLVSQVALNFYFSTKLVGDCALQKLPFVENFQRDDKLSFLFTR